MTYQFHNELQIDELVVQALSLTSRKATKEVESFANFLSEMQNSLKVDSEFYPVNTLNQCISL